MLECLVYYYDGQGWACSPVLSYTMTVPSTYNVTVRLGHSNNLPWDILTMDNFLLQIVMHLLCTYLDNHMPRNPRFPDGRPFSSQYFLKVPDKPGNSYKI